MLSMYNMYLSNPMYMNNPDGNHKVVRINSYKAVIESKDNGRFAVAIPFGQSSLFVLDLVNYSSEEGVISAAENFDIDKYKQLLGEQ